MDVQLAVAKTNKYASRESGDTVEAVERPHGGFSVVLADGQGTGRAAKNLSQLVTGRAISMIKDGARDGVVARAVHDYLYTYRDGKVSATLVIATVDLAASVLVLSRNSHCPVHVALPAEPDIRVFASESNPIGIYPMTRPVIDQLPLQAEMYVVTYSDGLMEAGRRENRPLEVGGLLKQALDEGLHDAQRIADFLMSRALEADANRPSDDISVLVLAVHSRDEAPGKIVPLVRRMTLEVPV